MYPRVLVLEPSVRPDMLFQLFTALIAILGFMADGGSAARAIHRLTSGLPPRLSSKSLSLRLSDGVTQKSFPLLLRRPEVRLPGFNRNQAELACPGGRRTHETR
jgi:hypothetical protein